MCNKGETVKNLIQNSPVFNTKYLSNNNMQSLILKLSYIELVLFVFRNYSLLYFFCQHKYLSAKKMQ